jgi:hypothetical protein
MAACWRLSAHPNLMGVIPQVIWRFPVPSVRCSSFTLSAPAFRGHGSRRHFLEPCALGVPSLGVQNLEHLDKALEDTGSELPGRWGLPTRFSEARPLWLGCAAATTRGQVLRRLAR